MDKIWSNDQSIPKKHSSFLEIKVYRESENPMKII